MQRGKDLSVPISNSCRVPYTHITIDLNFDCFICGCDGWLPIPVGKVLDFHSLEEVWNSPVARILQKDIDDKKFTWCAVDRCGIKHESKDPTSFVRISIDQSCNLACPSCRSEQIMITEGPEFEEKIKSAERILEWLNNYEQPIEIGMTGNGDPFASRVMRPIIKNFKPKEKQQVTLITNGLLLDKHLPGLPLLNNIKLLQISIDAGTESVYHDVRRPGRWQDLMRNFDWISDNGLADKVLLMYVLQKKNYNDLPAFSELCMQRGFRGFIMPLDDWGSWTLPGEFNSHNVLDPKHPEHEACMKMVRATKTHGKIRFSPSILPG